MNNFSAFCPQFIQESTLKRLHEGTFVPNRRSKPGSVYLGDRRETLSPLAITKRCIRYEPIIFENRLDDLLSLVDALNDPVKKVLMLSGSPQTGKTSLVRGIVELMGGGPEQIFWFETLRHSDFDEIIRFLIDSIYSVCHYLSIQTASPWRSTPEEKTPLPLSSLQQLKSVLTNVSHIPILVVIDNIHYLVDEQQHFNSAPFKELLNFLLSFANMKLILIGDRLPYGDLNPALAEIHEHQLESFVWQDYAPWVQSALPAPGDRHAETIALLEHIASFSDYRPWQMKTLLHLVKNRSPESRHAFLVALESRFLAQPSPHFNATLLQLICGNITFQEKCLLALLAFPRHPVNQEILELLLQKMEPEMTLSPALFQSPIIRMLVQRIHPPQWVAQNIKKNPDSISNLKFQRLNQWITLHPEIQPWLYQQIPHAKRAQIHQLLANFHLYEKNKLRDARRYPIRGKSLESEAKYHQQAADQEARQKDDDAPGSSPALTHPPRQEDASHIKIPFGNAIYEINPVYRDTSPLLPPNLSEEEKNLLASPTEPVIVFMESPHPERTDHESSPEHAALHMARPDIAPLDSPELHGWREIKPPPEMRFMFPLQSPLDSTGVSPSPSVINSPPPYPPPQGGRGNKISFPGFPSPPEGEGRVGGEKADEIQKRLAEAVSRQDKSQVGFYLLQLALHYTQNSQLARAETCLQKAAALKTKLSPLLLAEVLTELAVIYKHEYHHDTALDYYQQAEEVLEALTAKISGRENIYSGNLKEEERSDATLMLGLIYEGYGSIATFRHQHEKAHADYVKALEYFHISETSGRHDNSELEAQTLVQLAQCMTEEEQLEPALRIYEQALAIDERLGNRLSCTETFIRMGLLCLKLQTYRKAVQYFKRSLHLNREQDAQHNPELSFIAIEQLAYAYICLDRIDQSEIFYKEGLQRARQMELPLWQATFYYKLGCMAEAQQHFLDATEYYTAALALAEKAELSDKSIALLRKNIEDAANVLRAS